MSMSDKEIKERVKDVMNNMTPLELLKLRSTIIQVCILSSILKKKLGELK